MVKSMSDPDYVYQPHSDQHRERQSVAQRARLGLPDGHVRVYGVHVPEAVADTLRPIAAAIAGKQGFEAAHAFVATAESNGWKYDASAAPVKKLSLWTPERRKAASDAAKARASAQRAKNEAQWERQRNSPENRLRVKLHELHERQEKARVVYFQCKGAIEELEAVQKTLAEARVTLTKYGLVDP